MEASGGLVVDANDFAAAFLAPAWLVGGEQVAATKTLAHLACLHLPCEERIQVGEQATKAQAETEPQPGERGEPVQKRSKQCECRRREAPRNVYSISQLLHLRKQVQGQPMSPSDFCHIPSHL